MIKQEFAKLFMSAIHEAVALAEGLRGRRDLPNRYRFELQGIGIYGGFITDDIQNAIDSLYLGEELSYRVIDVAVKEIHGDLTVIFVRASGHPPVPWDETFNASQRKGPFKVMGPSNRL